MSKHRFDDHSPPWDTVTTRHELARAARIRFATDALSMDAPWLSDEEFDRRLAELRRLEEDDA